MSADLIAAIILVPCVSFAIWCIFQAFMPPKRRHIRDDDPATFGDDE